MKKIVKPLIIVLIMLLVTIAVVLIVVFNDDLTKISKDSVDNKTYIFSHEMKKGTVSDASISVSHHNFSETAVMISIVFNQQDFEKSDYTLKDIEVSISLEENCTVLKALSKEKDGDYVNMEVMGKDGKVNATFSEEYGEIILILENIQNEDIEIGTSYKLKGKGLYSLNSFEVDTETIIIPAF